MTAAGGTMVPVTVVERLLLEQLRIFLPFWLGVSERAVGYEKGTLPNIETWGTPRGWLQQPTAEAELPFVAFTSPGMAEDAKLDGDGFYSVVWAMEATCGVSADDLNSADRLAKAYGAAIAGCVVNQLPGEPVEQIVYLRDEFPIAGADEDSVIVQATEHFTVKCSGVLQRYVGVAEPPDDPREPPDPFPQVENPPELDVEHQEH